ncbi:hypothetical protein [Komarekiella delphini-convector]|nr:hypothetical protein [Komarekiella delphini-convector]
MIDEPLNLGAREALEIASPGRFSIFLLSANWLAIVNSKTASFN